MTPVLRLRTSLAPMAAGEWLNRLWKDGLRLSLGGLEGHGGSCEHQQTLWEREDEFSDAEEGL